MKIDNNQVRIKGIVASEFIYDHNYSDTSFYDVLVKAQRDSGCFDTIPIIVSSKLFDCTKNYTNKSIYIEGSFRSYNMNTENGRHLILSVFATDICLTDKKEYMNEIELDGYICRKPTFRETPLGRKIADVALAVNRPYGKSDYIPCICWGRNAKYASTYEIGDHISLVGMIQSRIYTKKYADHSECRTAYEVSVVNINKHTF